MQPKKHAVLLAILLVAVLETLAIPFSGTVARQATSFDLVDVRYSFSNGFVFTFSTNGKVGKRNLPGSVSINGRTAHLDCVVDNSARRVLCHTTRDLGTETGDPGFVSVNGQSFAFFTPKVTQEPASIDPAAACVGQSAIYLLDATCSHGIDITDTITVPPGDSLSDAVQVVLDIWASFGDPLTVNSITFVMCTP